MEDEIQFKEEIFFNHSNFTPSLTPKQFSKYLKEMSWAINKCKDDIIKLIEDETDEYKQFIHYDIIKKWKDRIIKEIKK